MGVAVTQEADDSAQLLPAVDRVEERLKTATDGGRRRLHHTRQYREVGQEGDRFFGEHAVGKWTERNHPKIEASEPTGGLTIQDPPDSVKAEMEFLPYLLETIETVGKRSWLNDCVHVFLIHQTVPPCGHTIVNNLTRNDCLRHVFA